MKLHATSRLRHHFFGTYSAAIGLVFEDAESARLALPKLGVRGAAVEWRTAENPRVVLTCVEDTQLPALKEHLGTLGADVEAIDSVAHSIDHGDPFNITVDVEDPRQGHLFNFMKSRSLAVEELGTAYRSEKRAAAIRLKGQWLKLAGFTPGQGVTVQFTSPGVLELRLQTVAETDTEKAARLAVQRQLEHAMQAEPGSVVPVTWI